MIFLLIPFILQGAVMFVDEFYFHHKRGLPLWEKIGHPLDSLSVLICYAYIFFQNPTDFDMKVYIGLCAFSCLLVTKDEFVHTGKCDATENWLHSLLFILHPITFLSAGVIWKENLAPQFLMLQPIVILSFMIYQILYWGPLGKSK